jgi:hypothetical protein
MDWGSNESRQDTGSLVVKICIVLERNTKMSRILRSAFVAVLALVAVATVTSAASALTVAPAGTYTAASGTTTLGLDSNGQSLTCSSSSIAATINSDGTGTVPAGSAVYTNCNNALLGPFTVTQTSAWSVRVVLLAGPPRGIALVVTVPTNGVRLLSNSGINILLAGTVTLLITVTLATGLPLCATGVAGASIQRGIPSISSTLAITSSNSTALFPIGLRASRYSATYDLSRLATVCG